MDKRIWRLTIGRNHYFLSDKEKTFYLNSLAQGNEFVEINGLILSKNFLDISSQEVRDATEKLDSGKWQCDSKVWHSKDAECYCTVSFEQTGNTTMRVKS